MTWLVEVPFGGLGVMCMISYERVILFITRIFALFLLSCLFFDPVYCLTFQALARRLGVRQLPEIVAFVNGEAVSMKASRYNVRGIVDFASDALSTPPSSPSSPLPTFAEVIVLESSSAFDWFVSGWRHDNLARTLFIGPRTTLRFTVPCFMLRKRHLCAFVHSSQPWIMDKC